MTYRTHTVTHRTTKALTVNRHSMTYDVPAGSPVEPIEGEPGMFWVDPTTFPAGSFARHDAEHYGFRVAAADVEEA